MTDENKTPDHGGKVEQVGGRAEEGQSVPGADRGTNCVAEALLWIQAAATMACGRDSP
jgi:hypothetical protein